MSYDELQSEAEAALREADPLCIQANALLKDLKKYQEDSTVLWAKILFLHYAHRDQLQNMGNLYILIKHSIESAQIESDSRLETLIKSHKELKSLLSELAQVHIDPALMNTEATSLVDFVHMEDIQSLDSQVGKLLEDLKGVSSTLRQLPDRMQRELSALRERQPKIPAGVQKAPAEMASLTTQHSPVVHEIAEVLTNLTRHYDLVTELPSLKEEDYNEAKQVVDEDRSQVATAVKQIFDGHKLLSDACATAKSRYESLQSSYEAAVDYCDRVDSFITHSLRGTIRSTQKEHKQISGLFNAADVLLGELNGLSEYYRLFCKSYHAVIVELARRRQAQQQLCKVIEETNSNLQAMHKKEGSIREDFVTSYKEYLPPDLWPDLETRPLEYSLKLNEEVVPEVSKSALAKALKELH